jgi:hypothetical protein
VEGHTYWTPENPEATNCSLIKSKKADFGGDFLSGMIHRYFPDHEVPDLLEHRANLEEYLVEKFKIEKEYYEKERAKRLKATLAKEEAARKEREAKEGKKEETEEMEEKVDISKVEIKANERKEEEGDDENMFEDDDDLEDEEEEEREMTREEMIKKLQEKFSQKDNYRKKDVKVEYDEEAYVKTFGDRIKKIEFVGFDKIWERLHNLIKISDLDISNKKVAHLSKTGKLSSICPNLRHLSIEDNLLCSWDQVFLIGKEFKFLSHLNISKNLLRLENPDTGVDFSHLRTYNSENQIASIDEEEQPQIFKYLTNLVMIRVGLTFKKLTPLMTYFQKLEELVICQNNCNDFENMDITKYQNIKRINLESNNIDNTHQLEVLGQIKQLNKLNLIHNSLSEFREGENYQNLTHLVLSDNKFDSGRCFEQLGKIPKLRVFKFRNNPYCKKTSKRHVFQWAIAENPKIRFYNGQDVYSYDITDAQYYMMRYAFHEFFRIFEKDQFTYKFSNFEKWAEQHLPLALKLIEQYENPYPELDESKRQEGDEGMVPGQSNQPKINYIKVTFVAMAGPLMGKEPIPKTYPITTDFLYIRTWVSQTFKLKDRERIVMKYKVRAHDVFEEVDDLSKGMDFYGFKTGSQVVIELKEEEATEMQEN